MLAISVSPDMTAHTTTTTTFTILTAMLSLFGCGDDDLGIAPDARPPERPPDAAPDARPDAGPELVEYQAKLLIEHNAAAADTGYQIFFDWDPWTILSVTGPGGEVLDVDALGPLDGFGLTEMFFQTNEPPAGELSREEVLAVLPEGDYTFEVQSVEGDGLTVTAALTHDIPAAAVIATPVAEAVVSPDEPLVVSWTAVELSLDGDRVDIAAYRVIVNRNLQLPEGEGFSRLVFDATVPPMTTSLPVPAEYLRPGTPYEIEVLAIEASGNQTIAATTVSTTGTAIDDLTEVPGPEPTELAASRFLVEHNATDEDTGYQIFLDGEPWARASVATPPGQGLLAVTPRGNLARFGLTEMFFETNEPAQDEVSLADVLSAFPEGDYRFAAETVEDAITMTDTAVLSHDIPAGTTIAVPEEDVTVDSARPLAVAWSDVTQSIDGAPVDVVAYQLIVVKEEETSVPTAGFFEPTLSVRVPADTTAVIVPAEFLEAGAAYEIEVLALEDSGNQTISLIAFDTR